MKTATIHVRWMVGRDMESVYAIELYGDREWIQQDFLECMRQRNVIGMVAESGADVIGFMVYALNSKHIEILNFVVRPSWRRRGVGMQMIQRLLTKLCDSRRNKLVVRVREENLGMQLFLKAMGFRAEKIDGDHYVMVRRIAEAAAVATFEEY